MAEARILLVEDDPKLGHLVCDLLRREGFTVDWAERGKEALVKAARELPNLILLDLNLPDEDGLDVCERLKAAPSTAGIPVFMLTARAATADVVMGLETGAEDYLAKPFNNRELLARIRVILRRNKAGASKVKTDIKSGRLRLDSTAHKAFLGQKKLDLTGHEFALLEIFLRNEGTAMTRAELLRQGWGGEALVSARTVDVHVAHVRTKLGAEGKRLVTVRQVGFRLEKP